MQAEHCTPRHTAYHEAGHAVIAHRLGFKVTLLTIVPNEAENTEGSVTIDWFHDFTTAQRSMVSRALRRDYRDYVVQLLAGELAEARATNGRYNTDSGAGDYADGYVIARIVSKNPERYLADCRRDARKLVRQHWGAITAVAAALLEKRTVQRCEFLKLIEGDNNDR